MIIAVDFDGTLCEDKYPFIGRANEELIRTLRNAEKFGDRVILWTCRSDKHLRRAVRWCAAHGLFFDAVNENLPEVIEKYGGDSRKIFADIYIDDKMQSVSALHGNDYGIFEQLAV
ncbi:MAG: hypothetical protein Q4E57_01195 [Eubacteriales bacterium]|nr:hypothetical protein [Eubacteriales bacterium]